MTQFKTENETVDLRQKESHQLFKIEKNSFIINLRYVFKAEVVDGEETPSLCFDYNDLSFESLEYPTAIQLLRLV